MAKKKPSSTPATQAKPKAKPKSPARIKEEITIESTEVIQEGNVTIVKTETIEITEVEGNDDQDIAEAAPAKTSGSKRDEAQALILLNQANQSFQNGNYPQARAQLLPLLEGEASHETREQAQSLLARMEMDVRTLMVGAVGMLMLLMIPTIGFGKALWLIPVLFLILLIDPALFRAPDSAE
jgi:hypothetical protein